MACGTANIQALFGGLLVCLQVNITSSVFDHNKASKWGAAVTVSKQGKVGATGVGTYANVAEYASAAWFLMGKNVLWASASSHVCALCEQVTVDRCSFQHNTAKSYEGAMGVYDSSKVSCLPGQAKAPCGLPANLQGGLLEELDSCWCCIATHCKHCVSLWLSQRCVDI